MLIDDFAELFEGRRDAFGIADGGCLRSQSPWLAFIDDHLVGRMPIGVYPMRQSVGVDDRWHVVDKRWLVKWGCVDFDIKSEAHKSWDYESEAEAHTAAVNLQKVLRHLGATSWIERTRSCGRHVWLFASTWVPASTMRHALLTACKVAGVSSREINPKQTQLGDGQLGNYVRLPYPGALTKDTAESSPQAMLYPTLNAMGLKTFVAEALYRRTSPDVLEKIASKWRETTRAVEFRSSEVIYGDDCLQLARYLSPQGRSVFFDGPRNGDRSNGLAFLAHCAREAHLALPARFSLLVDADSRWGKFSQRADRDQRLWEIIERAGA